MYFSFIRPPFPAWQPHIGQIGCHAIIADNLSEKCTFAPTENRTKERIKTENGKMDNDEKYMREAIAQAMLAYDDDEVPVGAVITCGGKTIARAYNMTERLRDPTAHAEMQAITMATEYLGGKYLGDCEIYVTVEPCPMCAAALGWAQVRRVVYGASDPKKGFSLYAPSLLHPKTEVRAGVLEEECGKIMSDFFKGKR